MKHNTTTEANANKSNQAKGRDVSFRRYGENVTTNQAKGGELFFIGFGLYTAPPIFFTREALFKPL